MFCSCGDRDFLPLTASVSVVHGAPQTVIWSTNDPRVATVDSFGVVTGKTAGTVTITATSAVDSTKKATKMLSVIIVGRVSIEGADSVLKGNGIFLTASFFIGYPARVKSRSVTWSTSDSSIATVDFFGEVVGVRLGTATITATSTVDTTKTADKIITVVDETTSIVYLNKINLENASVVLYNTLGERIEGAALRNLKEGVYLIQQKGSKKFIKAVIR